MKKFFLALVAVIFLTSCSIHKTIPEETLAENELLYKSYIKFLSSNDSVHAEKVKNTILTKYPRSKETFDLASSEFYERMYPVWTDDSAKVKIVEDMLEKYPETTWRRTLYQYYINSLSSVKDRENLVKSLTDFQKEFSEDYLPYTTSSRYYYIDLKDTLKALESAIIGYLRSESYKKAEHYPVMEWELEKRSAKISSGSYLGEMLTDINKFDLAQQILYEITDNNLLGVDDETTLCRPYYLLGKLYSKTGDKDRSLAYIAKALIAGDSRNVWKLCDSLHNEVCSHKNSSEILNDIRKRTGFSEVIFNDRTDDFGLGDISASRIAWGDYGGDGYQDMLLDGRRLFKNESGRSFREVTSAAFPENIQAGGGLWGDFDNDGDLDIITKDPEAVWLNDKSIFTKLTGEGSVSDNGVSTEGVGIADLNKDGFLDIYFANYEKDYVYEKDEIFFGTGGGKFRNMTDLSNILPADGKNRAGRGVSAGDFNNDGSVDIYVSNYRLTENFLFKNDGLGNFKNSALEYGVAGEETGGWWGHTIGSEWGDVDNDGDLDLISANLAHPRYIDFSNMTMLYENKVNEMQGFKDIRREAGIRYEETHSEPAFGDLDNDRYLDLYINCVYEGRRSFLYMNNGNKTFRDVTYLSGTRHYNGWGCAFADIDNDGDLDMLAAGGKIQLFINETPEAGNWLEVSVKGKDHCDGIGTRLKLYNESISLIREIQGGKGSTNQHSLVQHFGLGKESSGFTLEIIFPEGQKRTQKIDRVDQIINIEQ